MSSYSELIKNFEKTRAYMREFYIYGFKSRDGYQSRSARSYDDERRRIESWLGEHMRFIRTAEGKNVYISIDSRVIKHNPFHKAWKAKSFTDGDITLHFIIFDILHTPSVKRTLAELLLEIDEKYLSAFDTPFTFDESTLRKKLKEYCETGIIKAEKQGRKTYYSRQENTDISSVSPALHYFSEVAPCGVIGSFLLDKQGDTPSPFTFKHHYIAGAIDSGVLATLFTAMREKRAVTLSNLSRRKDQPRKLRLIPLRILISVQSGRQHLFAYVPEFNIFNSYRIDYISNVKLDEQTPRFDELRAELNKMQGKMWGVNTKKYKWGKEQLEHVDFTIRIEDNEEFIVNRLYREKRIGNITKLDENTYKFEADVYDSNEMLPWIRTFICRIVKMNFSNRTVENNFKNDILKMYEIYGINEEAT